MPGAQYRANGLDDMIAHFDGLAKGTPDAAERMDAAFHAGVEGVRARLAKHTRTGRTQASVHAESHFTGSEWTGTLEVGIPGPEGEHATGAVWLLADGVNYLEPMDHAGQQVAHLLDAWIKDHLEG